MNLLHDILLLIAGRSVWILADKVVGEKVQPNLAIFAAALAYLAATQGLEEARFQ